MTTDQAFEAMSNGVAVRRPCWNTGYHMLLNGYGIEETRNAAGEVLAMGFRTFNDEDPDDWEIYPQ